MREPSGIDYRRRVVHQLPEEAEGVLFGETRRSRLSDLHLERLRLVVQRPDGSVQLRFDSCNAWSGQPSAERLAWCRQKRGSVLFARACGAS